MPLPVELITPAVKILPPVTLPVALINPLVILLPPTYSDLAIPAPPVTKNGALVLDDDSVELLATTHPFAVK